MQNLQEAIKSLDPENNDNWTGTGLPSVDAVGGAIGGNVTRKEIGEAMPGYDREAARKAALGQNENDTDGEGDYEDKADEAPPAPELTHDGEDIDFESYEVEIESLKNENDGLRDEMEALKKERDDLADLFNDAIIKDLPDDDGEDVYEDDAIGLIEMAVAASKHPRYARNYPLKSFLGAWASNNEEIKQLQKRLDDRDAARNK